jgi:hypothetical protein
LQERWLAACAPFPIPISDGDDDREKALFIVVDEGSGRVIGAEPLPSADHEQIAAALGRYFRGENSDRRAGLPLEIAFASDELQKSLGEALRQFGITATVEPDPPALAEALRALDATFAKIAGSTKREQHRSRAPMPTTLTEWKEADLDFVRRLIQEVCHGRSPPPRAVTRFFGSHTVFNDVMDELEALQPMAGFMEWFFADYRATNRSLTLFERLLHGGRVTPLDRVLIQARIDARFSIIRIDSTEPGATLQVEDVITGARATIHDRAFSGCDIVGAYFPLRLIRLGEWDTCVVAGPPLSHVALDQFMQLLETMRVELTPEGMRRSSHLTGRLWDLELELRHHPNRPTLCNTDGEPLESHTATFHVADADAVERMLRARADLEFDEAGRSWCWSRPGGPAPGFGGNTVLARIEILGDRLVVEVNSRGRLERARQWIDRLPGVRFERASVREPFDDPSPLDDRLKTSAPQKAPDPELRKQLEKLQLQALRRWLDTPVPALRNLTPRAACATADGRRRVALMVRTLPAMGIPGGSIPPPRAELLRELGLDSAS